MGTQHAAHALCAWGQDPQFNTAWAPLRMISSGKLRMWSNVTGTGWWTMELVNQLDILVDKKKVIILFYIVL